MFIVTHRKIFYTFSLVLIALSIGSIAFWGLKQGTDFSGGSSLSIEYPVSAHVSIEQVQSGLKGLGFGDALVRSEGTNGFSIKTREITPDEKNTIESTLSFGGDAPTEKNFSSIGPVLGKEALQKSWVSILLVLLAIVLFVAFAFRKVSRPISSWVYGIVTILALLHDVIVPTGIFAILGHYAGFEIDTLFVTALLVILGFSVHDTIVVFDRIRENLHRYEGSKNYTFETIVGQSISETFTRSINTSLTVLFAIMALYIWGPEAVHHFSLTLLIGIAVGTYSSIFIGSPLLVTINSYLSRK